MKKKNYIITTAGKFHHFEVARAIKKKKSIIQNYFWLSMV